MASRSDRKRDSGRVDVLPRDFTIVEDSTLEEPGAHQVIEAVKRARLPVPVFLSMTPETMDGSMSHPVDEETLFRCNLDEKLRDLDIDQPYETIFPCSLFLPMRLLDASVPYFRFNYEDCNARDEAGHVRILYNMYVYSIAFMQNAAYASRPGEDEVKYPNRGKVEVVIEPVPAPGYGPEDWHTVGASALLGYFFHAWVQLDEPMRSPSKEDLQQLPELSETPDEPLELEDLPPQGVTQAEMRRAHIEERRQFQLAHDQATAHLEAQYRDALDAADATNEPALLELKQQWVERAKQLGAELEQQREDMRTRHALELDERDQQAAERSEVRARNTEAEREWRRNLRARRQTKLRIERELKQYESNQFLLRKFFGARGLVQPRRGIADEVEQMLMHAHSYAPDTCMCVALRLLSENVIPAQLEDIVARLDKSDSTLVRIKLYRDLVANAAHLARDGVSVGAHSFYSAIEWYARYVIEQHDYVLPVNLAEAARAWQHPESDARTFRENPSLDAVRFCTIFDPRNAFRMATIEYARACQGTPHPTRQFVWPGVYPQFDFPAFRVQSADLHILSGHVSIPPLMYHYYLHAVMKYMRTPPNPPAAPQQQQQQQRGVADPACVGEDSGDDGYDDDTGFWANSDTECEPDSQSVADAAQDSRSRIPVPTAAARIHARVSSKMTRYMGVHNAHLALGFFYQMQSRIRKRIAKIVRLEDSDLTYVELHRRRVAAVEYFRGIWSRSADIPDAMLAVVQHLSDRMTATNGRIFDWRLRFTSPELSPFQHYIAHFFRALDVFMGIHVSHNIVALIVTGSQHVFSTNTQAWLHPHVLFRGSHGIGKSHAVKIAKKLMVPGTFVELEHISTHALTVDGVDTNFMVFYMEEAAFVRNDSKAAPAQGGLQSASTGTNILKNIMDSRESGATRYVEGKREVNRIECNNVFQCTTNTPEEETNLAIQDRMSVVKIVSHSDTMRLDRKTAADSERMEFDRRQGVELRERGAEFVETEQLMHSLIALAYTMIGRDGVLLPKVTLEVVKEFRLLWGQMQSPFLVTDDGRTKRANDQNQASRKYDRLNSVCEYWTIKRALLLTFFCPNSPFGRQHKFCLEDMLAIAPLLATPVEVLYYALGLLHREFIDSEAILVLRAITDWMYSFHDKHHKRVDLLEITSGPWDGYYRLSDVIGLHEAQCRGSGRGNPDDTDDNDDNGMANEDLPVSAAAASSSSMPTGDDPRLVGAYYEAPHVSMAVAEAEAYDRAASASASASASAGSSAAIVHNYRSNAALPRLQSSQYGSSHDPKRDAAAAAAREFSGRKAMGSNAREVLFNVVESAGTTTLNTVELRRTLRRLGQLTVPVNGPDRMRRQNIMSLQSSNATTFDLYVHKSVFFLKDPIAEFFDLVDRALHAAVQTPRVLLTGVTVPYQPVYVQRRLLKPANNAQANEFWNPQLIEMEACDSLMLPYSESRQRVFVETDKDIDVKGIRLCLEHLRIPMPDVPSFENMQAQLTLMHRDARLPHAVPIDPFIQTMELMCIPEPSKLRSLALSSAYYDQTQTLASFVSARQSARRWVRECTSVTKDMPHFQRRLRKATSKAIRNRLKKAKCRDNPNAIRYNVELQPFEEHFERTKRELLNRMQHADASSFDMKELHNQLPPQAQHTHAGARTSSSAAGSDASAMPLVLRETSNSSGTSQHSSDSSRSRRSRGTKRSSAIMSDVDDDDDDDDEDIEAAHARAYARRMELLRLKNQREQKPTDSRRRLVSSTKRRRLADRGANTTLPDAAESDLFGIRRNM